MEVSIVICNFNNESFLGQCISSLANQDFTLSYEIILIDDASTDNSLDIARKLNISNLKIIESRVNGGISVARNKGIQEAIGKYILFVDSDDYVSPDYISSLYRNISTAQDNTLVFCDFEAVDLNGVEISKERFFNAQVLGFYSPLSLFLQRQLRALVWDKIYISKILKDYDIRFTGGIRNEEIDFNVRYLRHVDFVQHVSKSLIYYRQHSNAITKTPSKRLIFDMFSVFQNVFDIINEDQKYIKVRADFINSYIYFCLFISLKRTLLFIPSSSVKNWCKMILEIRKAHKQFTKQNKVKITIFDFISSDLSFKQKLFVIFLLGITP